jgi:tight adherence protein B
VIVWLNGLLLRSGFANVAPAQAVGVIVLAMALLGFLVFGLTGSLWISVSVLACLTAQCVELLNSRISKRIEVQNQDWPKFLDAIHSAAWAGSSLQEAILESRNFAPKIFRSEIAEFEDDCSAGLSFDDCLENLKARLASPIGDRFVEVTKLAHQSGGRGYLTALRAQSAQLRLENATWNEIRVKQNWVLSTAKLAVLAPWLVLLVLGSRRETAIAFESENGIAVLLIGLVASLLSFRLIKALGKLPIRKRTLIR